MSIKGLIRRLFKPSEQTIYFQHIMDSDGFNLTLDPKHFSLCQHGTAPAYLQFQYIYLQSLVEQGAAETLANGFSIASEALAALDDESESVLQLPPRYPGEFDTRISGTTGQSTFAVRILPLDSHNQPRPQYQCQSGLLIFGNSEHYRLTPAELLAFTAVQNHPSSNEIETANLWLVGLLQKARDQGMALNLSHFEKLEVAHPQRVGINAVVEPGGDLILIPNFGGDDNPVDIANREGQLNSADGKAVMRIRDRIVVLDETRLRATHEVISNKRIPKEQLKDFLATPSAFLDASLVDLDLGFSLRVKGATRFTALEFGETDESGINWFDSPSEPAAPPSILPTLLKDADDLRQCQQTFIRAQQLCADEMAVKGQSIDISQPDEVTAILDKLKSELESGDWPQQPAAACDDQQAEPEERVTVDLDEIENQTLNLQQKLEQQLAQPCTIDFSVYKRQPYPHQKEGIHWFTSLAGATESASTPLTQGALLADDMGLGKTYMSLVGIGELYRQLAARGETCKPVLIVAPLSLLENWADEVALTCPDNTFRDIVVLQANQDLPRFRIKGAGNETRQRLGDEETLTEDAIRYALKTGKDSSVDRLDMDRRLVLTTYQTLRDYQFSLCRIDWSLVIFDEAQNIKNPNTLQTRAAKGLKADFKLLATGTPVENSLLDYWCLMDTAQPGLLGDWTEFRERYVQPITQAAIDEQNRARLASGQQLRADTGVLMLRRLKEEQLEGLPEKRIFTGSIPENDNGWVYDETLNHMMSGEQLQSYNAVVDNYQQIAPGARKGQALGALQQLRSISLHPRLGDDTILSEIGDARAMLALSGKLQILQALLEQVQAREEKVLIFATSKRLQALLRLWLQALYQIDINIINGETKAVAQKAGAQTRKGIITDFEARAGFGILIMSPVAAGVGLTVVGANNVIHLERHWNPAKEAQATDRVYRIGQKRNVNVYLPTLLHPERMSFDINLDQLLNRKTGLKDAVVTPQEVQSEELEAVLL
ncbi:MAG: DEAD/DEAH box helicase [Marinobacterium sp.]|nr:DEAD/DEAH box helicase [Marinobacterium sp.]